MTTATPPLLKYRLCKLLPPLSSIFAIRFQHIYRYIRIYSIAKQQGQVSVTYIHILVMNVDSSSSSSQEIRIVQNNPVSERKKTLLAFFLISLTSVILVYLHAIVNNGVFVFYFFILGFLEYLSLLCMIY